MHVKKLSILVGLAIIVVGVLLYLGKGLFVAAIVDGQPISRLSIISMLEEQDGSHVLGQVVIDILINHEEKRKNITVSQSEIDKQIKMDADSLKTQGRTIDQALASKGLSKEYYLTYTKKQIMLKKLVGKMAPITDQQVQDFIDKNRASFDANLTEAQMKVSARHAMEDDIFNQKVQALEKQLREKANTTYFVNY